jgi:fumarate reductase flavoprotein subunit
MKQKVPHEAGRTESEADLVVIGGGAGGLAAALVAVESGVKNVILLEKRFVTGGNASMAGGFIFGAGSKLQKEAGVEISPDEVFKETMSFHHYDRINPRILRTFIDNSGGTIDWLTGHGAPMEWKLGSHILKDLSNPVGSFNRVMKTLAKAFTGASGVIMTNTEAKEITRDRNGKVTGIIALNKDGNIVNIKTGCVVLCTGGFTGNRELLSRYFPDYYGESYWTDALPLLGDGISLAGKAGAALEDYCTLVREPGYSFNTGKGVPNRAALEPVFLWVNQKGLRFIDEAAGDSSAATNALTAQPGKIAFALFDDAMVQQIMERRNADVPVGAPGGQIPDFRQRLNSEANLGSWSCVSADWAVIARWIGAAPEVLRATVEEYNRFCGRGHDDLFAKEKKYLLSLAKPPFYALKFRPLMVDTVGPVRINELMEVLDKDEHPIPGFYAAGVITGGWQSHDYHIFGSALGYSLTSGRIAGAGAARYILHK